VHIISPAPDTRFELGEPITFAGTGFSPDFGNSNPAELVWASLAGGTIGIGQQLTTTEMPVGSHWVTLQAPDGAGSIATKSVPITVIPRRDDELKRHLPKVAAGSKRRPCGCNH
jgi:hypothetical protein